jgi:hypothetical protein
MIRNLIRHDQKLDQTWSDVIRRDQTWSDLKSVWNFFCEQPLRILMGHARQTCPEDMPARHARQTCYDRVVLLWQGRLVCLLLCVPQGRGCICELYWHNITSFNNNSFHTIHAPVRFEPSSTRDPTATHHLSLPGLRYKTLLTTWQTSSPVEVWHVRVPAYVVK